MKMNAAYGDLMETIANVLLCDTQNHLAQHFLNSIIIIKMTDSFLKFILISRLHGIFLL